MLNQLCERTCSIQYIDIPKRPFGAHISEARRWSLPDVPSGDDFSRVNAQKYVNVATLPIPRGTRRSVERSGQHDWPCVSGANTENRARFVARCQEYVTAARATHFILAVCDEFEDDLLVMLDGASSFKASPGTGRQGRDDLAVVTPPSYAPDLTPVEDCWRQLYSALNSRFVDARNDVTTAIDTALNHLSAPNLSHYF